jgi:hypothetical protein
MLLDDNAVKRLKRAVDTDLDLLVWVGEWLTHLNLFSDAQIYDILRFAKAGIESFDKDVKSGVTRPMTLGVCDSRWVSVSGMTTFLDTGTSEELGEMGQPAVTHIFCDIAALRDRCSLRQRQFHGFSSKSPSAANDQAG